MQLSKRQVSTLLRVYLLAQLLTVGVNEKPGILGIAAVIVAAAAAMGVYAMIVRPQQALGCQNSLQVHERLYGAVLGKGLNAVYAAAAVWWAAGSMRAIGSFFHRETAFSPLAVEALLLLVAVLGAGRKLVYLGRLSEIVYALLLIAVLTVVVMIVPHLDVAQLRPVSIGPASSLANQSIRQAAILFLDGFFVAALCGNTVKQRDLYPALLQAVAAAAVLLALIYGINQMALGTSMATQTKEPTYQMAGLIAMGQFFRRPEAWLASVALFAVWLRVTVLLFFFVQAMKTLCKSARPMQTAWAGAAVVFSLAGSGAGRRMGGGAAGWILFAGIPVLSLVVTELRRQTEKRKRVTATNEKEGCAN